jgi:hypothetical protein
VFDDRAAIPRWAKVAVVGLEVLGVAGFAVVLLLTDDIATFLTDRVGTWVVIVAALAGTAILIWVAYLLFDNCRGDAPRLRAVVPRWIRWGSLVVIAAAVGFLLGVVFPRDTAEKPADTPTLIATSTIPRVQP